MTKLVFVSTR